MSAVRFLMRSHFPAHFLASTALCLVATAGCVTPNAHVSLPDSSILERDQLIIRSDFHIPSQHRLVEELALKRMDMSDQLKLPLSNEPINVYIFKKENDFRTYMDREHPEFPNRRAFFVKNDTTMMIYAFWGDKIGEDLRHEAAHGYLHSVIPNLPLWLDEGIAEYFECPRGARGFNSEHVYLLNESFRRGDWEPNLQALQAIEDPAGMNQIQYAESWLWIHFLLQNKNDHKQILQDQLARLRMSAESEPLTKFVDKQIDDKDIVIIEHLKRLAEEL